jgi:hypothetical protein
MDGTSWRTFMRLLQLDDLMTSYTHARPIAIPEKSVFRLVSPLLGMWPVIRASYRESRFSGLGGQNRASPPRASIGGKFVVSLKGEA